jgi:hypothetical protein
MVPSSSWKLIDTTLREGEQFGILPGGPEAAPPAPPPRSGPAKPALRSKTGSSVHTVDALP